MDQTRRSDTQSTQNPMTFITIYLSCTFIHGVTTKTAPQKMSHNKNTTQTKSSSISLTCCGSNSSAVTLDPNIFGDRTWHIVARVLNHGVTTTSMYVYACPTDQTDYPTISLSCCGSNSMVVNLDPSIFDYQLWSVIAIFFNHGVTTTSMYIHACPMDQMVILPFRCLAVGQSQW
jgi:hypothetical protein